MEQSCVLIFGKILSKKYLDEICRCCLSPSVLGGIFDILYEGTPLVDILYSLFGTQVDPLDNLPKKLCEICISEIVRCYIFKKRYEASEAALRNMIPVKTEAVNSEIISEVVEELGETQLTNETIIADVKDSGTKSESNEGTFGELEETELYENIITDSKDIFTCSCKKTFASKLEFCRHLPCNIGGKVFTKHGLQEHTKTHSAKVEHHCDQCKGTFASNRNLQRHRLIHIREILPKDSYEDLKVTDTNPNTTETCNNTEKNLEEKVKITKQKQTISTCSCEKTFKSKLEFCQHRKLTKHHLPLDHPCKICGKVFSKDGLRAHSRTHSAVKPFGCDRCDRRCSSKANLQIHMLTHTGERPHVCEFCDKSFTQRCSLNVHIRIHTGEKPFLCDFCGKRFAKKVYCTDHMRIHNVVKLATNFVCDQCGRYCLNQRAYKLHLYKHGLGQKQIIGKLGNQHQCKICKKSFTSHDSLSSHVKTYHEEKRFLCPECGKRFRVKVALEAHSLVHSGEKSLLCEFCDKRFARRMTLQLHRYTHTGERPYSCPLCPKKFTQSASLNIHLKVHTGEKPHVCTFCDKAFSRKDTLNAHVRVHTGEKPYKCDQCTNAFSDLRCLKKHKKRIHSD